MVQTHKINGRKTNRQKEYWIYRKKGREDNHEVCGRMKLINYGNGKRKLAQEVVEYPI